MAVRAINWERAPIASAGLARVRAGIQRVRRAWDEGDSDAVTHMRGFRGWAAELPRYGLTDLRGARVLDIGCGDRAPLSLLLARRGARVEAIDLLPVRLGRRRPLMWPALLRREGAGATLRHMVRDSVHTWRYWQRLGALAGGPLPFDRVHFQTMDATALRFAPDQFRLVVSSAVWEHIADVRQATREVNRVLTADGLAIIQIALFPALQGGHHPEWHAAAPPLGRTIRPWDHLRADARPLPLFCNGWREEAYREVFAQELRILRWEDGAPEGGMYLTPEIRAELAGFSEHELLTPFVTVWAGKRG